MMTVGYAAERAVESRNDGTYRQAGWTGTYAGGGEEVGHGAGEEGQVEEGVGGA